MTDNDLDMKLKLMEANVNGYAQGLKDASNKEKRIQEYESKRLIDELSKMPPMVIATAYLHAINYTLYGENVTEKWLTATQNASALEKAYREGYYDALQKMREEKEYPDGCNNVD